MNIYSNKQKWKIILFIGALVLIGFSLFISNSIVTKVGEREKLRAKIGEKNSRAKWWRITFADDREIILCGIHTWAKENGYDDNAIYKVHRGKHKTHKDIVSVEKLEQFPLHKS